MFTIYEHNEEREWMKLREAHKQYAYEQGFEKGREEGREKGREEGITESLHNLMKNLGMTEEEARIALSLKQ